MFFRGYFVVNYPSCQRLVSWDAHCCCSCHSLKLSAGLVRHSLLVEDCCLFLIITGAALCVVRVRMLLIILARSSWDFASCVLL